ncbi:MAG: metallophosphoesterase, partial [Armatimonadota bacterium]|nr:metallophosphoesterase [Armatimonadota bacterium]
HGRAVIQLPPLTHSVTTKAAEAGQRSLFVADTAPFRPGTRARVFVMGPPGRPAADFEALVTSIREGELQLAAPLPYSVPPRTPVHAVVALFEMRDGCEELVFEHLTLEGSAPPNRPQGFPFSRAAAFLARGTLQGPRPPASTPLRHVTIRHCTLRRLPGRGISFYATSGAVVEHCQLEDVRDAAIHLGHFSSYCRVVDNRIERCGVGVQLNDAFACFVARNRVNRCGVGANLWRWVPHIEANVRNTLVVNEFLNSRNDAIAIRSFTRQNTVRANRVVGGTVGILLEGFRNVAAGNTVSATQRAAILVTGDACTAAGNRIEGPGSFIRITGRRNCVWDNLPAAVKVRDEGKQNQVRAAEAGPPELTLVHLSDTHVTLRAQRPHAARQLHRSTAILENAVAFVNRMVRPDFVLHSGDMVNWADEAAAFDRARRLMDRLDFPWYPVTGNHDPEPRTRGPLTRRRVYTTAPHKGVRVVVLGTYRGAVEPELLQWLRTELSRYPNERLIVATHHPLYVQGAGYHYVADNAGEILDVLRPATNVLAILSGHDHAYSAGVKEGRLSVIAPALVQEPCRFLR